MRSLFLLFFTVFFSALSAQEITVKGFIHSLAKKPYANQAIKVKMLEDFITFQKDELQSDKTGTHGDFELKINVTKSTLIFLVFGNKVERTLWVEPGKAYFLDIKAPIEALNKSVGHYAKDVLPAEIVNRHGQEINTMIDSLEDVCSEFLARPNDRRDIKKMEAFLSKTNAQFKSVNSIYFKEYLRYKNAELLFYFNRNRRVKFAHEYFDLEKNIAGNVQATRVFSSFFKNQLQQQILIQDKHPFHAAFKKADLEQLLNLIYNNVHAQKNVKELLLLQGIYEVFSLKYFTHQNCSTVLEKIIAQSTNPLHQKIARNIQKKVLHLKEGYPAENIILEKDKFALNQLKGKYVYLVFFKSTDEAFLKEVSELDALAEKYPTQLQIVAISTDIDTKPYQTFKTTASKNIRWLHYSYQNEILQSYNIEDARVDRYDIVSTAKFFLINPELDLVYSPAKAPSQGFAKDLQQIIGQ